MGLHRNVTLQGYACPGNETYFRVWSPEVGRDGVHPLHVPAHFRTPHGVTTNGSSPGQVGSGPVRGFLEWSGSKRPPDGATPNMDQTPIPLVVAS